MDDHTGSLQLYALAAPRLQAYLRDFLVYVAMVGLCIMAAVAIGTPTGTRAVVVVCIGLVLLYEPLSISLAGGTIGHVSLDLRIVRAKDLGPVSFGRALVRTIVKGLFGIWVFMAIYFTRRSQALHDLAAGTVVIPRKPVVAPLRGFALERRTRKGRGR